MSTFELPEPSSSSTPSVADALVTDVGGTHIRFALVRSGASHVGDDRSLGSAPHYELFQPTRRTIRSWNTIAEAIRWYLSQYVGVSCARPTVISIAGTIVGDRVSLTNGHWEFSASELVRDLGLSDLRLLNDFGANGWLLPTLTPADLRVVGSLYHRSVDFPVSAMLGPGTGLGVSAVSQRNGQTHVLDTEGGHMTFAPQNDVQKQLAETLGTRYDHLSWERIVSGPGLVNIYSSMFGGDENATPEYIVGAAKDGNANANAAIDLFCGAFGAFAGDVVMVYGAWGGAYLVGGLAYLVGDGREAIFRQEFEAKGRFSEHLTRTPTFVVQRQFAGLHGCACHLHYDQFQRAA
ncbi:MAG: glucokinase [Lysobacterales bacterium]